MYETRDECVSDLDGVVINESKFSLLNESNVNLDESSEGTGLLTVIAQFIVDIINWLKNLF